MTIPAWNVHGVLPPVDPFASGNAQRSPYFVSILDLAMRLATSPNRRRIVAGFLDLRQGLHEAGMRQGFQWIDGSFAEDVETLEQRPPKDATL